MSIQLNNIIDAENLILVQSYLNMGIQLYILKYCLRGGGGAEKEKF